MAQTIIVPDAALATFVPPTETSMKGSCVGSLCSGATAHQLFRAL